MFCGQGFFDHIRGASFVVGAQIKTCQRGDERGAFGLRGPCHAALQRRQRFGQAVKPDQQLQKVAVRLLRLRQGLLPGLGRTHRSIGIAAGQAYVYRTLKQLRLVGFARRVQHQAVGRADVAIVKAHFCQHHLVEDGCAERRAPGRFLCGSGFGQRRFGRLGVRARRKGRL